jgi:Ca2+-binding EF-hand superfamily protein
MLTQFQAQKITRLFDFWDFDGNGFLDRDDYAAVGRRLAAERGWLPGTTEYEDVQQKLMADWAEAQKFADTDNNNRIELDEWLAFCDFFIHDEPTYQVTVTDIVEAIFGGIDVDGDGRVEPDDWRMLFRVYGKPAEMAEASFEALDLDGDGYLTREEIHSALRTFFHSQDPAEPANIFFGALQQPA